MITVLDEEVDGILREIQSRGRMIRANTIKTKSYRTNGDLVPSKEMINDERPEDAYDRAMGVL